MAIKEDLKFSGKIIFNFALNTIVGFILFAMVSYSVKYAFKLYYYLFKLEDNSTVLLMNDISTYISATFFVLYLFVALLKSIIENYYELKKFLKTHKND